MSTPPVDPTLALQEAAQNDLVRRKLDMDALKKRLGDTRTQQQKLRESCEGFEAVFIQKMWEQMRKNVSKEGYLHSKDEETYQSLFDVELSKKMASAGGIGLADMLYEQLSQQLENTGRTTSPRSAKLSLVTPGDRPARAAPPKPLAADNLYSALPQNEDAAEEPVDPITGALEEIKAELAKANAVAEKPSTGVAAEWAAHRAEMTGLAPDMPPVENEASTTLPDVIPGAAGEPAPGSGAFAIARAARAERAPLGAAGHAPRAGLRNLSGTTPPAEQAAHAAPHAPAPSAGSSAPRSPAHEAGASRPPTTVSAASSLEAKEASGLLNTSWQGNTQVSATPKPVSLFGRKRNKSAEKAKEAEPRAAAPQRGMAPEEALWPAEGRIVSGFGWEDDPGTGKRQWNSGVRIAAPAETPVRACMDGTVIFSGPREGFGNTIVLEHRDGFRSYYSNVDYGTLSVGDAVPGGSNFAKVTSQPLSPADGANSAFYFEFKRGEMALNPESALRHMQVAGR